MSCEGFNVSCEVINVSCEGFNVACDVINALDMLFSTYRFVHKLRIKQPVCRTFGLNSRIHVEVIINCFNIRISII